MNTVALRNALTQHWPEYLMEAAELGLFMISACAFGVLFEHPSSPVRQSLPNPFLRRALISAAMGLTAIAIIFSPLGKQSVGHFNPAVTLTFLRLGKIKLWDAFFYIGAQFAGGIAGVVLAATFLRQHLAHPAVNYVATLPGPRGAGLAFFAEVVITFILMSVILRVSNAATLARYTGLFAGALVATYITFEAPLSGMSMNPARTLGSAAVGRIFGGLWIYFTAPPLGMLLAAEFFRRKARACPKLNHDPAYRCIFCGHRMPQEATHKHPPRTLSGQTPGGSQMIVKTIIASLALVAVVGGSSFAVESHKSGPFAGPKANTGYVTHSTEGGKSVLAFSDDFKTPDTPDPHWQIVDSKGKVYLLQRIPIKGDKMNRSIEVPG